MVFFQDIGPTSGDPLIYMSPQWYEECYCAPSASCIQLTGPSIAGLFVRCLSLELLLRSTLECLYNQSFIDQMGFAANISLNHRSLTCTDIHLA